MGPDECRQTAYRWVVAVLDPRRKPPARHLWHLFRLLIGPPFCVCAVMPAVVVRQRKPWRRVDGGGFVYFEGAQPRTPIRGCPLGRLRAGVCRWGACCSHRMVDLTCGAVRHRQRCGDREREGRDEGLGYQRSGCQGVRRLVASDCERCWHRAVSQHEARSTVCRGVRAARDLTPYSTR